GRDVEVDFAEAALRVNAFERQRVDRLRDAAEVSAERFAAEQFALHAEPIGDLQTGVAADAPGVCDDLSDAQVRVPKLTDQARDTNFERTFGRRAFAFQRAEAKSDAAFDVRPAVVF